MKNLERLGMALVFTALAVLVLLLNINHYKLTGKSIRSTIIDSSQANAFIAASNKILASDFNSKFAFYSAIRKSIEQANEIIDSVNSGVKSEKVTGRESDSTSTISSANINHITDTTIEKDKSSVSDAVSNTEAASSPTDENKTEPIDADIATLLLKNSIEGPLQKHNSAFLFLVIGLFTIGSLLFSFAKYFSKQPGISNNDEIKGSFFRPVSLKTDFSCHFKLTFKGVKQ